MLESRPISAALIGESRVTQEQEGPVEFLNDLLERVAERVKEDLGDRDFPAIQFTATFRLAATRECCSCLCSVQVQQVEAIQKPGDPDDCRPPCLCIRCF